MSVDTEHVGDGIVAGPGAWTFAGNVCDTFDDHIRRSVPVYDETHRLIGDVAQYFVENGGLVYDLGCSTGTLCRHLARRLSKKQVRIVGVDVEPGMFQAASQRSAHDVGIEYRQEDLTKTDLEACDLMVCCYVLQFMGREERRSVVNRVWEALRPGGGFVMIEKIQSHDQELGKLHRKLHLDFKRGCGFSDEEIHAKTRSLEGVLDPMSADENTDMLMAVGFQKVHTLFQHLCFQGWLAIK